ncbi:MAG: aminotransferase class I/II-fold pyridoxal phosphate-dependent enzyme [Clostridia bacterium]|nr:aminotransferase class I/II-fold pyridoxal phosphate-dependent enzyme [Clostridia bacterium]
MFTASHGGDIYSRCVLYDFSANVNPLGVPENVKETILHNLSVIEKYPDVRCTALKQAISQFENILLQYIVCGNGATDLIFRIVQTLRPKKALLLSPTFSEYEKALHTFGCQIRYFDLDSQNNFIPDKTLLDYLHDIDIFFLCNPNNPVGNLIEKDLLDKIIDKCYRENIYLVIDECFLDFVRNAQQYKATLNNNKIIILKAFTKIFAMAGLRLGYCLCSDGNLCNRIETVGQCWNVSGIAQVAGISALKNAKNFISKTIGYVEKQRDFLTINLRNLPFRVFDCRANFIFLQTDLPLDTLLLEQKILIRNCNNYRNLTDGYFRIAVRTEKENQILIRTLERILSEHG